MAKIKDSTKQMSATERAEYDKRMILMEKLEKFQKTKGETAKMRERMGLRPGEVPPSAWKMK